MSFPRYQEYRVVDIDWIEEIPSGWKVMPLLAVAKESRQSNRGMTETNLLSLSYGKIVNKDILSNDGLLPESFDTYQIVEPHDIVLRLTDLQNDKRSLRSALVRERGIITSAYVSITPQTVAAGYLNYLLRSYDLSKVFYSMGGGLRQSMKFSDLNRMPVLLPSLVEQTLIANFLDHETAKIDALIAEQEKLIELLKEKRQAVISHAVTKGLDPNVKMKDSGVEWLGQVPEHWGVKKLKQVVKVPITDGPHETPAFFDDGVPFVSAEAVSKGVIDFSKIRGFISEDADLKYSQKYTPQLGDIFMVKSGATTGICAIVETTEKFNIWSPLAAIRCSEQIDPYYVLNYMRSKNFQEAITLNWSFGTQQNIGMGVIENLHLTVPPLQEQKKIASRLMDQADHADNLIKSVEKAIFLLQERRCALISAAVTGQIDVRNFVPEAEPA